MKQIYGRCTDKYNIFVFYRRKNFEVELQEMTPKGHKFYHMIASHIANPKESKYFSMSELKENIEKFILFCMDEKITLDDFVDCVVHQLLPVE